jgi:hypothetical protein
MVPFFALLAVAAADPPPPTDAEMKCPNDPRTVCEELAGENYAFLFSYPVAARSIPTLEARLVEARRQARLGFDGTIAEARRFQTGRYAYLETYTLDADRPELLALAARHSEYAGGASAAWTAGTLIWDRRADRPLDFDGLFEDAEAAQALVNGQFCGALRAARHRALGTEVHDECPDIYFARLIPGPDGRVARLHFNFDPIDGTEDGQFDVELPVTAELLSAIRPAYRAAFTVSDGPVTSCHRASAGEPCR